MWRVGRDGKRRYLTDANPLLTEYASRTIPKACVEARHDHSIDSDVLTLHGPKLSMQTVMSSEMLARADADSAGYATMSVDFMLQKMQLSAIEEFNLESIIQDRINRALAELESEIYKMKLDWKPMQLVTDEIRMRRGVMERETK